MRVAACLCALLGLLTLLAACTPRADGPDERAAFLARHWADPVPAQGPVPAGFSGLEASLGPEACGQCHPEQWQAWRGSRHARSMGPGIAWQLHLMDQAQGNRCLRCHAPLAEQKALVAQELAWPARPATAPPAHVPPDLARQGLVCAACHVRGHRRFGPAPAAARSEAAGSVPHGGHEVAPAFSDSAFCAHCHQFPDDGPRTAGKLHEDTYRQWQASPFAARETCQSCHMPQRGHLWRGIHDPEMTRRAIELDWQLLVRPGREPVAAVTVRNVGAGHHFPTYMVPKVEVHIAHLSPEGRRTELARQVIGWTVDTDLREERADTRIPAGGQRRFELPLPLPATPAGLLELRVRVRPGEHYERTFVESLARADRFPAAALPLLRAALQQVRDAEYELLRSTRPLAVP